MIENFHVEEPLFEDQVNEIHQFTLTYKGTEYRGLFDEGNIQWFQPKPEDDLEEIYVKDVETKVRGLMGNYLQ
ncbi:hypothetical protein [Sporosarcina sp. FA9]|uniref:hypothetical protein n=1 Tax=Sporosarcina sp. FA9 TaxID=3413030 RepID=UPI003F658E73